MALPWIGSACECVCVRARSAGVRWATGLPPTCGRLWWHLNSVASGSVCRGERVAGEWSRGRRLGTGSGGDLRGRRSLSRRWQQTACVAAAPVLGPGCPGRVERSGRLPKVFVQASHGSGAKKMAGLPNFGGAGEGRRGKDGPAASRGRASAPTLDAAAAAGPPPNFSRHKLSGPRFPGCRAVDRRAGGIPSRHPEARGREAALDAADSAATTPSGRRRGERCRP